MAELLGDLVYACDGGIAGQSGFFNITIQTSAPLAVRSLEQGLTEAMLLVNEPNTPAGQNRPVVLCATNPTDCNAWHGTKTDANRITFSNVKLEVGSRKILRFTNLRVDASGTTSPNVITAYVSSSGSPSLPFNQPRLALGIVQRGLVVSAVIHSEVRLCEPQIPATTAPQITVTLREGFASAFRPKNLAQQQASSGIPYPPDLNQDVPGVAYGTETGFFLGGVPNTAPIQSVRAAGAATQGTRLFIRFVNKPSGLGFWAPIRIGNAVLVSSLTGPYNPTVGTTSGLGPAIDSGGTEAMFVYEILKSDASQIEELNIPVTLTFASPLPDLQVRMQAGFGPTTEGATPSFRDTIVTSLGRAAVPCGVFYPIPELTGATSIPRGTTGIQTLTVRNAGNVSGSVSVQFSIPPQVDVTYSGTGWSCTSSGRCTTAQAIAGRGVSPPLTLNVRPRADAPAKLQIQVAESALVELASLAVTTAAMQTYTVGTSVPGTVFTVDGRVYNETQTFEWEVGSTHTLDIESPQRVGSELVFQRWSNNGPQFQTIIAPASATSYIAQFVPSGQSMQCTVNPGVPPIIRRSGLTEYVGDVTLECRGGTPTPNGNPVPKVDIRVVSNTPITSRVTFPGYSEALLLIDEPHSSLNPSIPLLPCGTTGAGDDGQGSCSINAAGTATYNGSPGRPNVFQGQIDGGSILFRGVPVEPPGSNGVRVLRFTNFRVRADAAPPSNQALVPAQVKFSWSITPGGAAVDAKEKSVAFVQDQEVSYLVPPPPILPVCSGANVAAVANSQASVTQQFGFTLRELHPEVFRTRNASYPQLLSQNIPGWITNTESGFYAGSSGQADPGFGAPSVPLTNPFPALRGLNLAGLADSGTRIAVEYSNIPSGVKMFAGSNAGIAALVSPNTPANPSGFVELPISLGKAVVIYEVTTLRPFNFDDLGIRAAVAFSPNGAAPASISFKVGFAPVDNSSFPRFGENGFSGVAFNIQPCGTGGPVDAGISLVRNSPRDAAARNYTITVSNYAGTTSGTVTVSAFVPSSATAIALSGSGWTCASASCSRSDALTVGGAYPPITLTVTMATGENFSVGLSANNDNTPHNNTANDLADVPEGGPYQFVPVAPCRVIDTRNGAGTFGGPTMARLTTRDFPVPASPCGIPATAKAYALNVTVVPKGPFGYLSIWPTGSVQPTVSTLNSLDGRVKANAAIVPAGNSGAISAFVTDNTELIVDINGYFIAPAAPTTLQYYPVLPCRVSDTRNATGPLGGPSLVRTVPRTIPVVSSNCNIPATARAYSLNATVVPRGVFGYLTLWPTGVGQPVVSTLNAVTGTVTANAAIVQAGSNGSIDAFASDNADLVLDINGYFAPPGDRVNGLNFFTVQPYRMSDTRITPDGPLAGPAQAPLTARQYPVGNAFAYSMNATVVPSGPLGFLTLWQSGAPLPVVSTLNAVDGAITSNAAIVLNSGGFIQAYTTERTHLLLDVNGVFRPN